MGKSLLACAIVQRITDALGLASFLEITVEDSDYLDFSEYDHRVHGGVVLDGIGDAMVLHQNREILQGRPKVYKGGKSATMMYSYGYTLCNRAVVATFDLSAENLEAFTEDHWLSKRQNVLLLKLTEPQLD